MNAFSNVAMLCEVPLEVADRACDSTRSQLQILVCVTARKDPSYNYLKWFCETNVGIVTQCCLSSPTIKAKDQYLAKFGIGPFSYGLMVLFVYDNGPIFNFEVLDLTEEDLIEKFAAGLSMVTSQYSTSCTPGPRA
ncbi:hypothetical protein PVL29_019361 [Vitis rotundifolia]|uniref:Uncharacterized protein n=1 Tax=Vitis rotundifolia TaxID=103349 RepID=A0AA38Z0E7_VITRO|nr:hypothetical protein PVL29_019361 [Vitis rotundifolia]